METSHLLARIIGPYILIAGLSLMINRAGYQKLLDELRGQALLLLAMGAFTLILGLMMVQFHNIWVFDWPVLVTLIGWIMIIKGAMAMLAPDAMMRVAERFSANNTALSIQAVMAILFGVYMSYMGYVA